MANTFISHAEDIVDDVAMWGRDYVNMVVDSLSPDGRPFGMEKKSTTDIVEEYRTNLRGNGAAWGQWIGERVNRIVTLLSEAKLSDEEMASVHPYSIVIAFAIQHSARMEKLLVKELEKETLRPAPPFEERGMMDAGRREEIPQAI